MEVRTRPRIHKNKLLVRAEYKIWLPIQSVDGAEGKLVYPQDPWGMGLCPHLASRLTKVAEVTSIAKIVDACAGCRIAHRHIHESLFKLTSDDSDSADSTDSENGGNSEYGSDSEEDSSSEDARPCGDVTWCWKCRTKFKFERSEMRDGMFWFQIVTWQDFGDGKTPFESVWDGPIGHESRFASSRRSGSVIQDFEWLDAL